MKTILCTLGMILFICAALHGCAIPARAAPPSTAAPTCQITGHLYQATGQNAVDDSESNEDCLAAWYEFGDATGDYGPIDAADDYEASLDSEIRECITEDAPKASDGVEAESLYSARVAACILTLSK